MTPIKEEDWPWLASQMFSSAEDTAERMDRYYAPWVEAAEGPWSLETIAKLRVHEERRKEIAGSNVICRILFPGLARSYELGLRAETERRGTILAVAITLFHNERGRWPETLGELDLPGLAALRVDPYSGRDFVYKVRDGSAVLYTVASDGTDDGGQHDPRWAEGKSGHDYVFLPVQELDE
jgi:hypothetical protein